MCSDVVWGCMFPSEEACFVRKRSWRSYQRQKNCALEGQCQSSFFERSTKVFAFGILATLLVGISEVDAEPSNEPSGAAVFSHEQLEQLELLFRYRSSFPNAVSVEDSLEGPQEGPPVELDQPRNCGDKCNPVQSICISGTCVPKPLVERLP